MSENEKGQETSFFPILLTIVLMILTVNVLTFSETFQQPLFRWTLVGLFAAYVVCSIVAERRKTARKPATDGNDTAIVDPALADARYRADALRRFVVCFLGFLILGFTMFATATGGWMGGIAGGLGAGIPFGCIAYGIWSDCDPSRVALEDPKK